MVVMITHSIKMCFIFMLQYMDKQSLSYASVCSDLLPDPFYESMRSFDIDRRGQVFGLITDLNLTLSQYSWCSSIFYIGRCLIAVLFKYGT